MADGRCGFTFQRKSASPKANLLHLQVGLVRRPLLRIESDWACDSPLLPPSLPSPPIQQNIPVKVVTTQPATEEAMPLFRDNGSADSGSDSEDVEPNMDKANQTWAELMLKLDTLRSGPEGKKGKKKKGPAVVLETPEMRRIKNEMAKVEKEYMFSRKEAGKFEE